MFQFTKGTGFARRIEHGARQAMTDSQWIATEIQRFTVSRRRQAMLQGERYYEGLHDILKRKRTVIGDGGALTEVTNLPNNRIVDNQYKKMVDQKNNYLLGKPFTVQCPNESYGKLLKQVFNKRFFRLLRNVGEDALNNGIGWIFVYYDDDGQLAFKRFQPHEVIAG